MVEIERSQSPASHQETIAEYTTFNSFADVLRGHDNLLVSRLALNKPAQQEFIKALCDKANITDDKVRAGLATFRLNKDGAIEITRTITNRGGLTLSDWVKKVYAVDPDFSVRRGIRRIVGGTYKPVGKCKVKDSTPKQRKKFKRH